MNLITRLIGLNLMILMLWAYAALGGKLSIYIDIPSIVFVIGLLVGGALMCFPVGRLADAFQAVFAGDDAAPVDPWRWQGRVAVFARLYQLSWGAGLVAALVGLIAMLSDLSAPASIGNGMAVALVAPAYGALLAEFIFNPMQQIVMNQRPLDAPDGGQGESRITPVPSNGQSALFKGVAMIAVMVSMFMVPIVSFSEVKKEDALSPEVEATYLRYLYGDDATQSEIASARIEATFQQRQREAEHVYARLRELLPGKDEATINDMALTILAVPQPEGVDPDKTHLWREHLADAYYYKSVGAY